MNKRADDLAARIEQGARELAAYAEGLTDEEWRTPVVDGRSVGVVVHHVASVYPVEIQLAKAIATGNSVEDITWGAVDTMNGEHAVAFAGVSKVEAIELLKQNSTDAAAAVRKFSDQDLDRAAPFGLSFGAPVTAQFVIEDHPLRHSWHHLARIRATIGK
jgi:DinB family protein